MLTEIPHTEKVQNIKDIMVCVQGDSSTLSSTMHFFRQMIKTKKIFTAVLHSPFVPSSLVRGFWEGEGELGMLHLAFGMGGFMNETDYV